MIRIDDCHHADLGEASGIDIWLHAKLRAITLVAACFMALTFSTLVSATGSPSHDAPAAAECGPSTGAAGVFGCMARVQDPNWRFAR